MHLRLQFFSVLKDLTGCAEMECDLPEGSRVRDLLQKIYSQFPALAAWDGRILVGVGVEFVDRESVLREDDEVAIMPPVQGG